MAIAAKRPDEVLRWFDKMRPEGPAIALLRQAPPAYADRVAAAVASTHPERALEIYRVGLDAQLPHAEHSAYEAAVGYLKKLRPIYEALGRAGRMGRARRPRSARSTGTAPGSWSFSTPSKAGRSSSRPGRGGSEPGPQCLIEGACYGKVRVPESRRNRPRPPPDPAWRPRRLP